MTLGDYCRFLGELLYERSCSEGTRREARALAEYALKEGVGHFVYSRVPELCEGVSGYEELGDVCDPWRAVVVYFEYQLGVFKGLLKEHGIRFALIKGADLAYRVYPEACMREFSDWDVVFFPYDWLRAGEVLGHGGWNIHNWEIPDGAHHHAPPIEKGNVILEPHWSLPRFDDVPVEEIWENMRVLDGYEQVLSPELNLIMLSRHLGERKYIHSSLGRFLLDCGFLMKKESVDWMKLRELCGRWHFPYSGDILGAFPEFFLDALPSEVGVNPENARIFRAIFEQRGAFVSFSDTTIQLNQLTGIKNRCRRWVEGISFPALRRKYNLPEDTGFFRMFGVQMADVCRKIGRLCVHGKGEHAELREYLKMINKSEKMC